MDPTPQQPEPATPPATPPSPSLFAQLGPAGVLGLVWTFAPALVGFTLLVKLDTVST